MTKFDKKPLNAAFRNLRQLGYFARQNFWCCQTCAVSAVPDESDERYVVYHGQDADTLKETGSCYLAWSGNGTEIVTTLEASGVDAEWDGSEHTRIRITLSPTSA